MQIATTPKLKRNQNRILTYKHLLSSLKTLFPNDRPAVSTALPAKRTAFPRVYTPAIENRTKPQHRTASEAKPIADCRAALVTIVFNV